MTESSDDESRAWVGESWPFYDEDEIARVVEVLRSGRVNAWSGTETLHFEEEYAEHCGRRHGLAVSNGTLALELALHAFGIGPGDEVIVPARSFFASAACVVRVGARPVFADVRPETQGLDAETVAAAWSDRTKAVICVHLGGHPCALDELVELCSARDVRLIEDCAQAHGARYRGRPVGAFGDAGCFSFCQDKIISTGGEGGMLVLDDEDAWQAAWSFRDHGKSRAAVFRPDHPPGFRWLHESFGSNYRLTEAQSTIGRVQLGKLESWVDRRRSLARIYHDALDGHPALETYWECDGARHAFYRYYAFVRPERLAAGWSRNRLTRELNAAGVPSLSGSCPEIYREKAFRNSAFAVDRRLPHACQLGETSFTLEVHPTLSEGTVRDRAAVVRQVCDAAALDG